MIRPVVFLCLSFFYAQVSHGQVSYRETDEPRDTNWTIGLAGYQHSLKSGDGNNLLGGATAVQLGYALISDTWMLSSSLDVISGPYLAPQQQDTTIDYTGTGFTLLFSSSAEAKNIRSYAGNYGFSVGLNYMDIAGRAVVGDRFDPERKTDELVMRVTNFSATPSVFFTWLEPEVRNVTNDPQKLYTRLEGYILSIGFMVPILANYTLRYDQLLTEDADPDSPVRETVKEKGPLAGFSIMITFQALLGV